MTRTKACILSYRPPLVQSTKSTSLCNHHLKTTPDSTQVIWHVHPYNYVITVCIRFSAPCMPVQAPDNAPGNNNVLEISVSIYLFVQSSCHDFPAETV